MLKKGIRSSANRFGRLMTLRGIRGKPPRKFRVTTSPNPKLENSPDLFKGLKGTCRIDKVWVSDITYLETKEGGVYLCVILDLYNRKVIAWNIEKHMEASLVSNPFSSAITIRRNVAGTLMNFAGN